MTFGTLSVVIGLVLGMATLIFTAVQPVLTLLFTTTRTLRDRRHKLLAYRWYWRITIGVIVALIALLITPIVLKTQSQLVSADPPATAKSIDEAAVRSVVKESQNREFLEMYRDPRNIDRTLLDKFWMPGGDALKDVDICLNRLIKSGEHYGMGSRLVTFEFRYARVFGDYAEVGTNEHWYLPMVHADGSTVRQRNPDVGPIQVDYTLRKIMGRWLLEKTTTPYVHKVK